MPVPLVERKEHPVLGPFDRPDVACPLAAPHVKVKGSGKAVNRKKVLSYPAPPRNAHKGSRNVGDRLKEAKVKPAV